MKTDIIRSVDARRNIAILKDKDETVRFCVKHFISLANEAIEKRGFFFVALSGGSTPKVIFQQLAQPQYRHEVDWSKVMLFWSDERCVPPTDLDSNYRMAMDAGFSSLPVLQEHIFRMHGETDPQKAADDYNQLIIERVPEQKFDLVMLGMGEDGHTASLFPGTEGLKVEDRWVIANYVPQKETWRLS
ncbi:MAG: 6-phosphogluconolactonase, partial [Chlamydiae bacterium]|nr:6-phosphogluconolactonase [Chlamydiota bacterium]